MIEKLKEKNLIDLVDFFNRVDDKYKDTYITLNKERIFLKNNWSLIKKVLQCQECYGLFNNGLKGIIVILREKNFRPYVKLLAENRKHTIDLLKWFRWNFSEQTLFFKLKKNNPLSQTILKTGFVKIGDRGSEILFEKKGIKDIRKLVPKDEFLGKERT